VTESPFEYKQCIVLRTDLGMSVGKLISQACHAAVDASELAEGAKKVALQVGSLEELEELAERAEELGIVHVVIWDRGLTEVPPGTTTAVCIGPDRAERVDRVTGNLKLLK